MSDGHPPAFLFYPADFANDGKVEAMTTEEVGAYILLLCKSWREVPVGSLPSDDRVLSRWARLTPDRWADAKPSVMAAFSLGKDKRWHQKRLRSEFDKLQLLRARRAEAGKTGASIRWAKPGDPCGSHGNRMAKASQSDGISSSSASASSKVGGKPPTPPRGRTRDKAIDPAAFPGFARFWNAYPGGRKVDRDGCLARWVAKGFESATAEILAGIERWKASRDWTREGGAFVCAPMVFLNQRRWEATPTVAEHVEPKPDDISPGWEMSDDLKAVLSEIPRD